MTGGAVRVDLPDLVMPGSSMLPPLKGSTQSRPAAVRMEHSIFCLGYCLPSERAVVMGGRRASHRCTGASGAASGVEARAEQRPASGDGGGVGGGGGGCDVQVTPCAGASNVHPHVV